MKTLKQVLTGNISLLIINVLVINILGIFTLVATKGTDGAIASTIYKQILFAIFALGAYYIISKIDYTYLKQPIVLILLISITVIVLAGVLIIGAKLQGAKRWFVIGSYDEYSVSGVLIQPSEFAKIALIIINSAILSLTTKNVLWGKWKNFLIALFVTISFAILIFLEPDAGMTILTFAIGIMLILNGFEHPPLLLSTIPTVLIGSLLYFVVKNGSLNLLIAIMPLAILTIIAIIFLIKRTKIKKLEIVFVHLIALIIGFLAIVGSIWLWENKLKTYQKERITSFVSDEKAFQIRQSQIAIGSGQFWGKGLGEGTQSKFHFLPEYQTDFVFASFAEQFGFLGSIILLGLYLVMIVQIMYTSSRINDKFGSLICWGIAIKFTFEIFINIGMNTGLTPATGVPLPFMSVGGSNLLANYLAIAVVDSVYKTNQQIIT
ncbi:MAG TPA: rod shape-determining protein RodA [Candidatus Dojkabacteria bacterium]|nr:rod shape-determining protein RodA [Candidatus Dojkabacteria bacterium]